MRKLMKERIHTMLEDELKRRQRALNENRAQIRRLARDQVMLKKEWKEINTFMWELRNTPSPRKVGVQAPVDQL